MSRLTVAKESATGTLPTAPSMRPFSVRTAWKGVTTRAIEFIRTDPFRFGLSGHIFGFTCLFLVAFTVLLSAKLYADYQHALRDTEVQIDGIAYLATANLNNHLKATEQQIRLWQTSGHPGGLEGLALTWRAGLDDKVAKNSIALVVDGKVVTTLFGNGRLARRGTQAIDRMAVKDHSGGFLVGQNFLIHSVPPGADSTARAYLLTDSSALATGYARSGVGVFLNDGGFIALQQEPAKQMTLLYPPLLEADQMSAISGSIKNYAQQPQRDGLLYSRSPQGTLLFAERSTAQKDIHLIVGLPVNGALAYWWRSLPMIFAFAATTILFTLGFALFLSRQFRETRMANQLLRQSEELYDLAASSAKCGIWDWNLDSGQMFWSRSIMQILGRDAHALRMSFEQALELVHPSDRKYLRRIQTLVREGQSDYDTKFRLKHDSGKYVWVRAKGRIRGDQDRAVRVPHVVGVVSDITEELIAKARAQEAESRLKNAIDNLSDAFVLWDKFGRPLVTNSRYHDASPFDRSLALEAVNKVVDIELPDDRWMQIRSRVTEDQGLVTIGRDITDLKVKNAALLASKKAMKATVEDLERSRLQLTELAHRFAEEKRRAEEASKSKTEFLANMSHELRTPLNAIIGFSEIMDTAMFGPLGDERYEGYTQDILDSGRHLLELIDDILDMSRLEAGKFEIDPQTVEIDMVMKECLRIAEPRAFDAKVSIQCELENLPTAFADRRALKQILLHLLSNSVKFSQPQGSVKVIGRADLQRIFFTVEDDGIGIAADAVDKLGFPFVQIENQHEKSYTGSGLGLAICRSLVDMHHGDFAIESTLGVGTKVTFSMPRRETDFNGFATQH